MSKFRFGNHHPGISFPRLSAATPRADWVYFVNSDKKRRREARFCELWQCEIETFRVSNGYHEFAENAEYTAVPNDHEVTFCELPARERLQMPDPVCDTKSPT